MFQNLYTESLEKRYDCAKAHFKALGADTDAAIVTMLDTAISCIAGRATTSRGSRFTRSRFQAVASWLPAITQPRIGCQYSSARTPKRHFR